MIKKIFLTGFCLFYHMFSYSQGNKDSIQSIILNEVTIIGKTGLDSKNESKPLSSVDEYMSEQSKMNLIKRGSFALEPVINNMVTERISCTLDGMKIFCACTDKMDPITSYVEIINLSKMHIFPGIGENPFSTNRIGGSIDMKLYKAGFHDKGWKINTYTGYETNGNYRILGGSASYTRHLTQALLFTQIPVYFTVKATTILQVVASK
jgi:iron complex outermembrane receptor protein